MTSESFIEIRSNEPNRTTEVNIQSNQKSLL